MHANESEPAGGTPRLDFDETYKRHAVELTLRRGARTVRSIAQELGISEWTLYRWRQLYSPACGGAGVVAAAVSPEEKDREIVRLRAEVARLQEREIVLKKSLGILSETPGSGMPGSKR
jgi:transposase